MRQQQGFARARFADNRHNTGLALTGGLGRFIVQINPHSQQHFGDAVIGFGLIRREGHSR